jgi:hypothetical protein
MTRKTFTRVAQSSSPFVNRRSASPAESGAVTIIQSSNKLNRHSSPINGWHQIEPVFIYAYTEGFGQPPSELEIAKAMKVQPPSVNGMLKTLEKKQLIRRIPNTPRSIEILVDPAMIPRWKKKMVGSFQFYAPADASQQQFDQIMENIVRHRKAERQGKQC